MTMSELLKVQARVEVTIGKLDDVGTETAVETPCCKPDCKLQLGNFKLRAYKLQSQECEDYANICKATYGFA